MKRTMTMLPVMLLALVAATSSAALAQARQEQEPPPARTANRTVHILEIAHADAVEVLSVVREVVTTMARVTVDTRRNALVILASEEELERIATVVEMLDIEVAQREKATRIWALEHATAGELAGAIQSVYFTKDAARRISFAVDERGNRLIAQGPAADLESIGEIIRDLDTPRGDAAAREASTEMTVRVLWLIADPAGDIGRATPPDLAPVLDELASLGIDGLRLGAQSVLRVTAGESFHMQFVADLDQPWAVDLKGLAYGMTANAHRLDLAIRGETTAPRIQRGGSASPEPHGVVEVGTTITAPSGHFVVLGVTPIRSTDSVFVVQIR